MNIKILKISCILAFSHAICFSAENMDTAIQTASTTNVVINQGIIDTLNAQVEVSMPNYQIAPSAYEEISLFYNRFGAPMETIIVGNKINLTWSENTASQEATFAPTGGYSKISMRKSRSLLITPYDIVLR